MTQAPILILSQYAPSDNTPQAFCLRKLLLSLNELSIQTTVICISDKQHNPSSHNSVSLVTVQPIKKWALNLIHLFKLPHLLRLPDIEILYRDRLFQETASIIKKYQDKNPILISYAAPHSLSLVGHKLKLKYPDITWVAYFSDPWVENPYGYWNVILKWINKHQEKKVILNSDKLIFNTKEALMACLNKYPAYLTKKTHVVPHNFVKQWYPDTIPKNNKCIIRYFGSFYKQRNPINLFKAIQKLMSNTKNLVDLLIIEIYGPKHRLYDHWIQKHQVNSIIHYKGNLNYKESLEKMCSSDVLLTIDNDNDNCLFLPSKIIDYIGSKRPIYAITNANSPSAHITNNSNGWTSTNQTEEIISTINNMLSLFKNKALPSSKESNIYDQYQHTLINQSFIDIINAPNNT